MTSTRYVAHVDGGARGNPGPAACGVRITGPDGDVVAHFGRSLGRQTNNYAEYQGLIAALEWARDRGVDDFEVVSDSLLMVQQMRGAYKVKSANLKPLHREATAIASGLPLWTIRHVRRSENVDADGLVNEILDGEG